MSESEIDKKVEEIMRKIEIDIDSPMSLEDAKSVIEGVIERCEPIFEHVIYRINTIASDNV